MPNKQARKTVVRTINPFLAEEMLASNTYNYRKPIPSHVNLLARQIENGEWRSDTGESIKFDWNGSLIDGQHRLMAIVQARTSIQTKIEYGLDPEMADYVDHNRKSRTFANALARNGEGNEALLATSARLLHAYLHRTLTQKNKRGQLNATDGELRKVLASHHGLVDSIEATKRKIGFVRSRAALVVAHYLFSKINKTKAREFFEKLHNGSVASEEPEWALRRLFLESHKGPKKRLGHEYLAYLTMAFTKKLKNEPTKKLSWANRGERKDPFPYLAAIEYLADNEEAA